MLYIFAVIKNQMVMYRHNSEAASREAHIKFIPLHIT